MSFATELTAIESRFLTNWNVSDGKVVYGNLQYNPPSTTSDPWLRLTVQHGETNRASVYPDHYRNNGVIFTQVFVRSNQGSIEAMALADKVAAIWRGQQFSGIHCLAVSVVDVGISNGWYQVNVVCPFYHDELLPAI